MGGRNLLLLVGRSGARRDGTLMTLFLFFSPFLSRFKTLEDRAQFLSFSLFTPMSCFSCFFRVGVERS